MGFLTKKELPPIIYAKKVFMYVIKNKIQYYVQNDKDETILCIITERSKQDDN